MLLKAILPFTCLIFYFTPICCQLTDDFSDGDFSSNPMWLGDIEKFIVEDQILKLNDRLPVSNNTAILYTAVDSIGTGPTEWTIKAHLNFAPSSDNFAKIYLGGSSPEIDALEGYFLKIGGISGKEDALELFVQKNGEQTLLISGTAGNVAEKPVNVSIRVVRKDDGNWQLWAAYGESTFHRLEGEAMENSIPIGPYLILACEYTMSRNNAFAFDDIKIGPAVEDREPPLLLEVQTIAPDLLTLLFDEPLGSPSIILDNFVINNNIGIPLQANFQDASSTTIELRLANPLISGNSYEITANDIVDLAGNSAGPQSLTFSYLNFEAIGLNDIIISEIYPVPKPSIGLPEFEFIELYNRSRKTIDLGQLGFSSGGVPRPLPSMPVLPGEFIIVCAEIAAAEYAVFGKVNALSSFPALANAGDDLSLTDENGMTVFQISYSKSWYESSGKADGGYTLEIVDPNLANPDCRNNWQPSLATLGGTPGETNSWLGLQPDRTGPVLLTAVPQSNFELLLVFDESLDPNSVSLEQFGISNDLSILDVQMVATSETEVLISLADDLQSGGIYELTVKEGILDCLGNPTARDQRRRFGLIEEIRPRDIVINEVLFDPESGGHDFIELYNRSQKNLNLQGLLILNELNSSQNKSKTIERNYLLLPGAYVVLTNNPLDIAQRYQTGPREVFLNTPIPPLAVKGGNVTLRNNGVTIDSFTFEQRFHFPLLETVKGVSLERLHTGLPTSDENNWHSAASSAGFATPGLENSQFYEDESSVNPLSEVFTIRETTISPDGDGFQDVLLIEYQSVSFGSILQAKIFDLEGRVIYSLANNESLAQNGVIKWEGLTASGTKARMGIYILWFQLFSPDGTVLTHKLPIVVAGQLK